MIFSLSNYSMAKPFPKINQHTLQSSYRSSPIQYSSITPPQSLRLHGRALIPKPYSTSTPAAPVPAKFRSLATQRTLGCWVVNGLGPGGSAGANGYYSSSVSALDVSPASKFDLEEAMSRQTDASLTLAHRLMTTTEKNNNFACSPISINVVLSLIAAGSEGKTLDEFLSFLKSKNKDELGKLMSEIVGNLLSYGAVRGGPKLAVANGVWFDESLELKSKFAQVVYRIYRSDVKQVDFRTKHSEVRNEVNSWAQEITNGLIKEILPPDAVDSLTRLILTNAIYFKGLWMEKFICSMTKYRPFHLLSGADVNVPFMTNVKEQYVEQFDGFKVLGLPYKKGEDKRRFSMYIFLPDAEDGLPTLVDKLGSGSAFLDEHIPKGKIKLGKFLVPKFKVSYGFEASKVLKSLGLVSPFKLPNGLTEIADSSIDEPLFLSDVFHKTFIEVDEEGTEAAAVTVTFMCGCAPHTKMMDFVADHPFLFVIREDTTGLVLFIGQILDPTLH